MATLFPTSLDTFTNPNATDDTSVVPHHTQHDNINDSVAALETKVGVDNSAVTSTIDYKLKSTSSVDPGHKHSTSSISGQVATGQGGTGLAAIGSANQVLGVNTGATALEYKTITAGSNITVTPAAGSITVASTALANPMTTLGDLVYGGSAGASTRLAGDTSNNRKFLREQSSGGVAAAPAWDTVQATDVPVFVASGVSHAQGAVPDPGSSAGTTRFLREDATWNVPVSSAPPEVVATTNFESTSRFELNGSPTLTTTGASIATSSTASTGIISIGWVLVPVNTIPFIDNAQFSASFYMNSGSTTTGIAFIGAGSSASINNFATNAHIGIKIIANGSNQQMYLTQSDGTTENASTAIFSNIASNDYFEIVFKVNANNASVTYYYRKNGGSQSSQTLTGNVPAAGSSSTYHDFIFAVSNNNFANVYGITATSASWRR